MEYTRGRCGTSFEDFLEVTRLLRAYLKWRNYAGKRPITPFRLALAGEMLCLWSARASDYTTWTLRGRNDKLSNRRLRAAGIDPLTWEIIDKRRAGFAWKQLIETRRFNEKEQERLVASAEADPGTDAVIEFEFRYKQRKKPVNESFSEAIKERLHWSR